MRLLPAVCLLALTSACVGESDSGEPSDGGAADGGAADGGSDGGAEQTLLTEDFVFSLDSASGCTDTWLQAWDADGTFGLQVYIPGMFAEAAAAGIPLIRPHIVGIDDFEVLVEVAAPVAINYCTDAMSEREVFETWTATDGAVVIAIEPPIGGSVNGKASIELNMLTLADGNGHTLLVPGWLKTDIPVVQNWGG